MIMAIWRGSTVLKLIAAVAVITVLVTVKLLRDVATGAEESTWPTSHSQNLTRKANFLRIVHIDLKGAPPRMSYLLSLIPLMKSAGGNGILIEYEDAFPFEGRLRNISSRTPYKLEEVKEFVRTAEAAGMEVIPLVQTFGHLEYVLKLEEFRQLRESPMYPQEICPSKKEAVQLIKEMIRQVMAVHPNAKYLHIGCDEVHHLGVCSVCSRSKIKKIFSRHVYRIGSFVRATYPGVIPLIWDDMMRRWSIYDVQDSGLTSVVEPVIWVYGEDIPRLVPHYLWYIYFKSFPRVWAASAFKGASGETQVIPNLGLHFENNLSWLRFIKNRKDRVDTPVDVFGGIVLTGWSRYDHFALLCELLPAGLPSLILNLILVSRNLNEDSSHRGVIVSEDGIFRKWLDLLGCPSLVPEGNSLVIKTMQYQSLLGNCEFSGSAYYKLAFEYIQIRDRLISTSESIERSAWVSEYNRKKNYTSPFRVMSVLTPELEEDVFKGAGLLKAALQKTLSELFEDFVVQEWLEQTIIPVDEKLTRIYKTLKDLTKRNIWPRRPLSMDLN